MASPHRGEYCVSKAGLSMAAKLFAVRLAPDRIPVYEVRPGIIATDMTAGVKEMYDKRIAEGLVPEGRWGQPEDVGRAVASLLRGDIAYATGTVVQRRWWIVDSALMTKNDPRSEVVAEIEKLGVVAIIRMPDPAALRAVVDALAEGGVRALEVTMTVPRAIELIAEIAPTLPDDFLFGAGTVLDADTVHRAVDAGAQFIVSPGVPARSHQSRARRRRARDARLFHADRNSGRRGRWAPTSSKCFRRRRSARAT